MPEPRPPTPDPSPAAQPRSAVTFHVGQAVVWPASPVGWAQVEELRRRNVGLLFYRAVPVGSFPIWRRLRRAVVGAVELAAAQADGGGVVLPGDNPLKRAIVAKRRRMRASGSTV